MPKDDLDTCLIWSNEHRMWWGQNCQGYTGRLAEAGRYARGYALAIVQQAQLGRTLPLEGQDRCIDPPPEILVREADALASLKW